MPSNLTIARLLNIIKDEEYQVVFKRWGGKKYIYLGTCDYSKLKITINYNRIYKITRSEKRVLFIHEFLHAYFDSRFDICNMNDLLSDEDQEVVVEALARDICQRASQHQINMLDEFIDSGLRKADNEMQAKKRAKIE